MPERFLVISTTAIGDTLMGTPALRALRESFPGARIEVMVHSRRKELLRGNPHVDRIIPYRNNSLYRRFLSWQMGGRFYDHVLIFHANEDVLEIFRNLQYGDCLTRQKLADPARRIFRLENLPAHSILKRMAMVEKLGGKVTADYQYTLVLPEAAIRWAEAFLSRRGVLPGDRIIGLQLGSNDVFKCWPGEHFAAVARHLHSRYGAKIYLNAVRREKNLVQAFLKSFGEKDVFYHWGGSLVQAAALIRACSLFISPDTGPMHMAAGLQVPLIALFCPTDCRDTGPLGYEKAKVIQKPPTCSPCESRGCRDNFCMGQITVEEVCEAAERILGPPPGKIEG
jgi:ADP-heptose:LPS heptosyltransferase